MSTGGGISPPIGGIATSVRVLPSYAAAGSRHARQQRGGSVAPEVACARVSAHRIVPVSAVAVGVALGAAVSQRRRARKSFRRRSGRVLARWCCSTDASVVVASQDALNSCGVAGDAEVAQASLALAGALAAATPDKNLSTLATLAAAILCHEAGHFLCAKSVGLKAEEFSLGFGPELLSSRGIGGDEQQHQQDAEAKPTSNGDTVFVLRALPVGGYVRFNEAKTVQLQDGTMVNEFDSMSTPARLWVLAGGVLANMVVAWSSLCVAALTSGVPRNEPRAGIRVEDVSEEAIQRTGLAVNDLLLRVGDLDTSPVGQSVRETVQFIQKLPAKVPVQLDVERAGQKMTLSALTLTDPDTGLQRLGVMINSNTERVVLKATDFADATNIATETVSRLLGEQISSLQGLLSGAGAGEIVGPVGIVRQGSQLSATEGLVGLGLFFVTVNLNLALLNALPIPALDGGKAAFVLLEQVRGGRIEENKKQDIEFVFIILVILGLASLTVKDVAKIFLPS